MRRGFKAEAERLASQVRDDMGVGSLAAIRAEDIAAHLNIGVRSAADLVDVSKLQAIEDAQPGAFSACTFEINDHRIVVWSPLSAPARVQSDIAHELAHVLLKHNVKEVQQVGSFAFFACDPEEEQEATWLAGCLLLPRPLLVAAARKQMSAATIASTYGVSVQMANFRLRTSGVLRQVTPY